MESPTISGHYKQAPMRQAGSIEHEGEWEITEESLLVLNEFTLLVDTCNTWV